jgi:hypothetical protein
MRCRYCAEYAGLLRRRCAECSCLLDLYDRHRGDIALSELLDRFIATGVARAKIEAVLDRDPDGTGSLRDRVTADMANQLLAAMGVASTQTATDVRRLRERGGGGASTTRPTGDATPPRPRGSS